MIKMENNIHTDLAAYCIHCPKLELVVNDRSGEPVTLYSNGEIYMRTHYVRCYNSRQCDALYNYLKGEVKNERDEKIS